MPLLNESLKLSRSLVSQLEDACERIVVAGSIRRLRPVTDDIDLVCEPIMRPRKGRLFDDEMESLLDLRVQHLIESSHGNLRYLDPTRQGGAKLKRLRYRGVPVELWIVTPPASWGAILTIRTGPADFAKLLVTSRQKGGAKPDQLRQDKGALWDGDTRVPTDLEAEYFRALGVPHWPPQERTVLRLREFLTDQGRRLACWP